MEDIKQKSREPYSNKWIIKSHLKYARDTKDEIESVLKRIGLDIKTQFETLLSIHEALINVIMHRKDNNPDEKIELLLNIIDNKIEIVIYDFEPEFDYSVIKHRDLKDIKPHGLGVYFYTTFTDELEYFYNKKKGNVIKMVKYINKKQT